MKTPIRRRVSLVLRVLALLAVLILTSASDGCENTTTYVGVSYGYPGWGGPCCYYGPGGGWTTGVYMGGPVW